MHTDTPVHEVAAFGHCAKPQSPSVNQPAVELALVLLLMLTTLVYLPGLSGGFIFDDYSYYC